jgi:hypothetical protein
MKSFSEYRNQILEEVEDNKKREENYKKLKSLCDKYRVVSINHAYVNKNNKPNILLNFSGGIGHPEIKYSEETGWKLSGGLFWTGRMDWNDFKKYVSNLNKLIAELKNFDVSVLPIRA